MPAIKGQGIGHDNIRYRQTVAEDAPAGEQRMTAETCLRHFQVYGCIVTWENVGSVIHPNRLTSRQRQILNQLGPQLDRRMVFYSSNLGAGGTHSTRNLPVLLAGGGFKHGGHLAFDPAKPPPLCNLYVSMLQRLGINVDKFGSSTGTLRGLETGGSVEWGSRVQRAHGFDSWKH
jgi:hypothetical protein